MDMQTTPIASVISPDLVNRCLGRLELVDRILRAFDGQVERDLHSLRQALVQNDLKQVASIAHRMKGAAANCSMTAMANTAATIEQQARQERPDQLFDLLSDLDRQLDEFRLACERELTAGSGLR